MKLKIVLLGFLLISISACSDHGHSHDDESNSHDSNPQQHDTIK